MEDGVDWLEASWWLLATALDRLGDAGTDRFWSWGDADVRREVIGGFAWSATHPSGVAGIVGRLGSIDDEPEPDRSLSSLFWDKLFLSSADCDEKEVRLGALAGGGPGGGGGSGIPGSHLPFLEDS